MSDTGNEKAIALKDLSDQELIGLYRQGNKSIIDQLLQRYQSRVYRLAYGILRNPQDAEEVIQEVFLRVFQKLDSFKGESAFSSWLYRVAVNTTFMKIREKRGTDVLALEEVEKMLEEEINKAGGSDWARRPDDELLSEEAIKIITGAMEKLPDEFKIIITLRDLEGLSTEEVGQLLGLSPAAVKSRLHRARLFLRKRLGEFYHQIFEGE